MADCIVTMNLGHGADVVTRSKVRVRRLERGDNGEYVVAAGWSDVPTGRPFTTWTGEQGVVYQVDEQGGIPGGVMRTVELPAEATATYSELVDVVPLPPAPGVLGDQVIATAIGTPGTASNDILVETIAADPTVVDAAAAAVLGAGLDTAAADLVADPETLTGAAVIAQTLPAASAAFGVALITDPAFGAIGNGVVDDGPAIQAAAQYAIDNKLDLVFPKANNYFSVQSTITLRPSSGTSFNLDIDGSAAYNQIQWDGGSNDVVFDVKGWKRSNITGVRVRVSPDLDNVVVWDLDGDAVYNSLSQITWTGCHVTGTTSTNVVAWRIGHADPTDVCDFSYLTFVNCHVGHNNPAPAGTIAFLNEGPNSLNHIWSSGGVYNCDIAVSNVPTTGAHAAPRTPGPSLAFYGFGASGCNTDFKFGTRGTYIISGGRFEHGKRFLDAGNATPASPDVVVDSVDISAYTPTDGILVNLTGATAATFRNCVIRPAAAGSAYTAAAFTLSGGSTTRGFLSIIGGRIRASDPFLTIASGKWDIEHRGVRKIDSGLGTTGYYRNAFAMGEASNYVSDLIFGTGSASDDCYQGYQSAFPTVGVPRAVTGFRAASGGAAILSATGSRPAVLVSNGTDVVRALPTGVTQLTGGLQTKYTAPGAFPYTILPTDNVVGATTGSPKTLTLPDAATVGAGWQVTVKDTSGGGSTNNLTIAAAGANTIDGVSSKAINTAYGVLKVMSTGSNWIVL